jgi:hypothetical protein
MTKTSLAPVFSDRSDLFGDKLKPCSLSLRNKKEKKKMNEEVYLYCG